MVMMVVVVMMMMVMWWDDGDGNGSTQERVHKSEKFVNPQKLFSLQF